MKIAGLLCIFIACIGAGITAVSRIRERIELLYGMTSLLKHVKNEMYLHMTEYGEIFRNVQNKSTKQITQVLCEKLDCGLSIEESAETAFSTRIVKRLLNDEERKYLIDTILSAAQTDIDHAEKLIDCACERLECSISEELKRKTDEERLRMSLALYGGLAAVILLI
ncbi:MAG: stage III sporulation protein AB [Clostridia bacterium]|nr:stage III sporulation protein AB [Clostridia bacterium]